MEDNFLQQIGQLKFNAPEQKLILNAFNLAKKSHESFTRLSQEQYINHSIAVASMVASWNAPPYLIAAALLHDVMNSDYSKPPAENQITSLCGEEVRLLVAASKSISNIRTIAQSQIGFSQLDSIERLSMTYPEIVKAFNQTPFVFILRIANHLHNAQSIKYTTKHDQEVFARVALNILAPLAARLGMDFAKRELEDIGFQILDPEAFAKIAERYPLEKIEDSSKANLIALKENLTQEKINITTRLAPRSNYALYRQWVEKGGTESSFLAPETAKAYLVILNSAAECYQALGTIHRLFKPITSQFRDYIAVPKINGYRALHTKVRIKPGVELDLIICDQEMYLFAEYGATTNWSYQAPKLNLLAEQISNVPSESIVVFTPTGDPKVLPSQSTAIDFAYSIHKQLGIQCIAAIGNGKPLVLDEPLEPFTSIKIITHRNAIGPETKWLNSIQTGLAKSEIEKYYGINKSSTAIDSGREILVDTLDTMSINYSFQELMDRLNIMSTQLKSTLGQLLIHLAEGTTDVGQIIQILTYDDVAKITTEKLQPTVTVITVIGKDRSGFVADITHVAKDLTIALDSVVAFTVAGNIANMRISISEVSERKIKLLIENIKAIESVLNVYVSDKRPMPILQESPYPKIPAQGTSFKGRARELGSLLENLPTSGSPVLIWGPRRIGKTSLLVELPNHLDPDKYLPISIDLQDSSNLTTFDLIHNMIQQIEQRVPGIPIPKWSTVKKNPIHSFESLISRSILSNKIVVITIDECQILTELKEQREKMHLSNIDLMRYFRNQIQHNKQMRFIFSGGGIFRRIAQSEELSALLELTTLMELTYLDRADAMQIISDPVITYDPAALEKILEVTSNHLLTSNHPGYIQIICSELVMRYGNFVNIKAIDDWLQSHLEKLPDSHFNNLWGFSLGLTQAEQVRCEAVLLTIALEGDEETGITEESILKTELIHHLPKTEILRSLSELESIRTIEKINRENPSYRIKLPLAIQWLRKCLSMRELVLEFPDILQ